MLDKSIVHWYSDLSLEKESQRPTSTSKWFAPSKEMHKIQFLKTHTGDATLIDHLGYNNDLLSRSLIDCGSGPDYAKILGGKQLDNLVLTHAHLDHWTALPEVLELPTLGPRVWLSGSVFSDKLMAKQLPFPKAGLQIDPKPIIDMYMSRYATACALGDIGMTGWSPDVYDLNLTESTQKVEVKTLNHRRLHQGCIVPVIALRPFWIVLGADLEPGQWKRPYHTDIHFPRNIDVLQAPGHGRQRIKKEIMAYLNPRYVVVSSADSDETANIDYYRSFGAQVFCLNRGDVVVSFNGKKLWIKQK